MLNKFWRNHISVTRLRWRHGIVCVASLRGSAERDLLLCDDSIGQDRSMKRRKTIGIVRRRVHVDVYPSSLCDGRKRDPPWTCNLYSMNYKDKGYPERKPHSGCNPLRHPSIRPSPMVSVVIFSVSTNLRCKFVNELTCNFAFEGTHTPRVCFFCGR